MKKLFFEKTLFFIGSIMTVVLLFLVGSYYFFLNDYERLENSHNTKYVDALIKSIEHELLSLNRITMNYSMLESTHAIIDDEHVKTTKLKQFFDNPKIDFIAITNASNHLLRKDAKTEFSFQETNFLPSIIKKVNNYERITTAFAMNNSVLYLSKEPIIKNNRKIPSGYIYLIKEVTNEQMRTLVKIFSKIEYLHKPSPVTDETQVLNSKFFSKVYINNANFDTYSCNTIQFFGGENSFLFSIKTTKDTEIINTGKSTILIYMYVAIAFLAIIFFITHKYLKVIKVNNDVLEKEVEKRTHQIKSTLEELEKVNLKLYDIAHTDFLTKVRNRRNFFIHAENIYTKSIAQGRPMAVIMIDIDNFKSFNDNYGHDVGDQILVMFSNCVKQCLTSGEIFGRLGGEEFAIAIFDITLNDAMEKAEFIRSSIEKLELNTSAATLKITASFGVCDKSGLQSLDQMLQKADKLLYSAKRSGKNRVRSRLNSP